MKVCDSVVDACGTRYIGKKVRPQYESLIICEIHRRRRGTRKEC